MKVLALELQSVRADETVEEAVVRARCLSIGWGIPRWLARVTGVSLSPSRSELCDAVSARPWSLQSVTARKLHSRRMLGRLDWQILILFIGLIVVNHALQLTSLPVQDV